jgi:hypothetical protein
LGIWGFGDKITKKPRLITAGATTKKLSYENKNFLCRTGNAFQGALVKTGAS